MSTDAPHHGRETDRRSLLRAVGAAGAIGLAGCIGGGTQGDDDAFRFVNDMVPTNMQFNPYNVNNYSDRAGAVLTDPLAKYNPSTGELVPYLATKWSIDGDGMTVTLREGQTWHDDEPVTASDLATQLGIELELGRTVSDYVSSVEAVDERTVELSFAGAVNEDVVTQTVLTKRLKAPEHVFGEKLQALRDASDDEREDAQADLVGWTIDDSIGNSPFVLGDVSSQQFTAELRDDHPDSDKINFSEFIGMHLPGQSTWQALKQGQIDGTPNAFIAEEVLDTFDESILEKRLPGNVGYGLFFKHSDDIYGDAAVRRAIAHVIEREQVAQNSGGDLKMPVETPTGIPSQAEERFVGDVLDEYDTYETDHERATQILEDAGFTREDGNWLRPDGDALRAPITTPADFPDWMKASETIASQLSEFGIDAEVDAVEVTTFFSEVYPGGDFRLVTHFWGGSNPYPYFGLQEVLGGEKPHEFPAEISVPMPVGDSSGDAETVDVVDAVASLSQSSGDDATAIVRELTWAYNQILPCIPIQEKYDQTFLTTDDWDVPSPDDPSMEIRWPVFWLPRIGKLQAKTE